MNLCMSNSVVRPEFSLSRAIKAISILLNCILCVDAYEHGDDV